MNAIQTFWALAASKKRIVEFGTRRWEADKPTHHRAKWGNVEKYVMCDVTPGLDVDVLCDIHEPPQELIGQFDCFLAPSVWEHLKKPWIASEKVWDLLQPGGVFLVTTHQTFPIHGYPHDYFRFSKEALLSCFDTRPWAELKAESGFDCIITPIQNGMPVWNYEARGHIQSLIYGRKPL